MGPELGRILVEIGRAESIVGTDSASREIPELIHARDLGDQESLSAELARELRPDRVLVLAGSASAEAAFARDLREAEIPVHVLEPRSANEVVEAIHRIGRLAGSEPAAAAVAARVTREVSEVAMLRDGRARRSVAWVLQADPLVVVGGSGLLHEILELAGAENAFHEPGSDRLTVDPAVLGEREIDTLLGSPRALSSLSDAPRTIVDPAAARLPLLDLPTRVRWLHAALYAPEER